MKNTTLLFCFTLLLFFSCKESRKGGKDTIVLNWKDKVEALKLSEIADSVTNIQLETTEESVFYQIVDIQFKKGVFYIDDVVSKSIFLFDEKGKFITKFYKYGQGQGEYTEKRSFFVDDSAHIHVMDMKTIIEYNEQFDYIGETHTKYMPSEFYLAGDKYVLYMPLKDLIPNAGSGLYSFDRKSGEYSQIAEIEDNNKKEILISNYLVNTGNNSYSIVDNMNNKILFMEDARLARVLNFEFTDSNTGIIEYMTGFFSDYDNLTILLFSRYNPSMAIGSNENVD